MGRGMVLSRRNNVREAAAAFDQALQLAPKDPLVLREAGTFHYRKGDMARAEGLLRQAMQLDKNDFMARFFYARMLDETGRAQQAQLAAGGNFAKAIRKSCGPCRKPPMSMKPMPVRWAP